VIPAFKPLVIAVLIVVVSPGKYVDCAELDTAIFYYSSNQDDVIFTPEINIVTDELFDAFTRMLSAVLRTCLMSNVINVCGGRLSW
jgi:hypothetical protein